MRLQDPVTCLKGIGPKKAEALAKLGIMTLEDMMLFFPRDYEDRRNVTGISQLRDGVAAVIRAKILTISSGQRYRGRKQLLKIVVEDGTGAAEMVFFNGKYLKDVFKRGQQYIFYGKPNVRNGRVSVLQPEYSTEEDAVTGILPVYPLTKGISQKEMRAWQLRLRSLWTYAEDMLSETFRQENRLCSSAYALENIHFPTEKQKLLEARYRLVFDELLVLQTGLFAARQNIKERKNGIAFSREADIKPYLESLPYPMTGAQQRCIDEIMTDLESGDMMNRLIQGDVGSGKTAVAEVAMYKAVRSGYQAVLMAPTEILARQHYEGFAERFAGHGIRVGFLSGSTKASERREILDALRDGSIDILTGTHAVIQPGVVYKDLGLVITDEQHRFGVSQRVKLREKGRHPNVLVMTATPIPRTLAVILYGDLAVSVIDELPPGRQPIKTKGLSEDERYKAYNFMAKQLQQGRQAYVVTPLIEDSEVLEARSAEETAEELQERFPGYNVALLHGGMKQQQKDDIMEQFYEGRIHVLVATVVIEVGINVPNATVIVIENAERFGLAQLHQLRGRVGRGRHQSYCMLITAGESDVAQQRAAIMERSSDGFYIAEEDLRIRGPGEIFGMRQHGLPDLNISDLVRHADILGHARDTAETIMNEDPLLERPENAPLKRRVKKLFGEDIQLEL